MSALSWFAAVVVILGGVMLIFGQGAPVIWFGTIAIGFALFTTDTTRHQVPKS